jgi:RNA polymerase sigma-70 factor (ECF subfamily)
MDTIDGQRLWSLGRREYAFEVSLAQLEHHLSALENPSVAEAHASDLYLACGCCLGVEGAIQVFERLHRNSIDRALTRMALPRDLEDEVKQQVRTKLFVGGADGPLLRRYEGRGSLGGWVRAVTVRTAIDLVRKARSADIPIEGSILEAIAASEIDPDLRAIKESYRQLVNEAFESAFELLERRDRTVLRQHYLHQLDIDRLGRMYGVHRTTAFRWIASARTAVFASARDYVSSRIHASSDEAAEILRVLESQVDVNIEKLLRSTREP